MGSWADALGLVEFLKHRHAGAIEQGDDRTATRLRDALDHLMNGRPGQASSQIGEKR